MSDSELVPSTSAVGSDVSAEVLRDEGARLVRTPSSTPLKFLAVGGVGYGLVLLYLEILGDHNGVVSGFGDVVSFGVLIASAVAFLIGLSWVCFFPRPTAPSLPWSVRVDDDLTVGLVHREATIETWSYSPEREVEALEHVVELRSLVDERNERWREAALAAHRHEIQSIEVADRLRAAAG